MAWRDRARRSRPSARPGEGEEGAAAVEFALVVWPFVLLVVGILELGLLTADASIMDAATRAAARQVRTGVVQSSGTPLGTFQQVFCANLVWQSCSEYHFDVRSFSDFPAISLPALAFDKSGAPTNTAFQPGGPRTVVTVRAIRNYQFFTPLIGKLVGGTAGSVQLVSTAVLKTEPYAP